MAVSEHLCTPCRCDEAGMLAPASTPQPPHYKIQAAPRWLCAYLVSLFLSPPPPRLVLARRSLARRSPLPLRRRLPRPRILQLPHPCRRRPVARHGAPARDAERGRQLVRPHSRGCTCLFCRPCRLLEARAPLPLPLRRTLRSHLAPRARRGQLGRRQRPARRRRVVHRHLQKRTGPFLQRRARAAPRPPSRNDLEISQRVRGGRGEESPRAAVLLGTRARVAAHRLF